MSRTPTTSQQPPITPRFILHACQRCHGDTLLDQDAGEYRCLQCSRTVADAPAPTGPLYRFARFAKAA